jgi:hypothetical protein
MIGQFVVVEGPDKGKSYPVEAGKPALCRSLNFFINSRR